MAAAKPSETRQPAKFMFPSEIRFFARVRNWSELASERRLRSVDLTDYARRLMSHDSRYPKLQVVQLSGVWYALNSLQLAICRHLERAGHCRRIRVIVCSPQLLPGGLGRELSRGDSDVEDDTEGASSGVSGDSEGDDSDSSDCSGGGGGESDCSGSDSYCSECAAAEELDDAEADEAGAGSGRRRRRQSGSRRPVADEAAAAAAAPCDFYSDTVDTDLADLGPSAVQLLQRLRMASTAIPPPTQLQPQTAPPPPPPPPMSMAAAASLEDDAPERQNLL